METLRDILFLPDGASSLATEVDLLHALVIGTTMLGSTAVFLTALGFMWRYHESRRAPVTPRVRAPIWYEALVIGGILSLFLLFWAIGYRQYQAMRIAPEPALELRVVAKQWMWQFADPARARRSQSVLVVPRGRPVRLVMTSRDVIHSFFVPAFRLKQDVLPGTYTSLWFEATHAGTYHVYCAEYCGVSHSRMRAAVVVLEPQEYERWLEGEVPEAVARANGRVPPPDEKSMVVLGEELAVRAGCLSCHTVTGEPHIGPSWRGLYGSIEELENGALVAVDEDYLTESIMEPERDVVRGFRPVMPSYRGLLGAGEVAALVEYIRSLREPPTAPPLVDLPEVVPREEGRIRDGGTAP
ncbi:MAG TPA: cytochrome c oxidase subunit II [Sandaracinaceae bacterium]